MEIKDEKTAWETLQKAQEVFKPILDFRFNLTISPDNFIEISIPSDFLYRHKRNYKRCLFRGKTLIEAVDNFYRYFKKGRKLRIIKNSDRIEFISTLYMRKGKWLLKKDKLVFNFFKSDGSLHSNLRPYPEEKKERRAN